jgi:hypothetical protein
VIVLTKWNHSNRFCFGFSFEKWEVSFHVGWVSFEFARREDEDEEDLAEPEGGTSNDSR